jgi:hypothetical protein
VARAGGSRPGRTADLDAAKRVSLKDLPDSGFGGDTWGRLGFETERVHIFLDIHMEIN